MTEKHIIEISGPAVASLMKVCVESSGDEILELRGRRLETREVENTDAHSRQFRSTQKIIISAWRIVNLREVIDIQADINKLSEDTVGFIRLRSSQWRGTNLGFSDRRLIRYLENSGSIYCFIVMNNESNDCLGVKNTMAAHFISYLESRPASVTVPCLGEKTTYVQGSVSNTITNNLVQGLFDQNSLDDAVESFDIVSQNFKESHDVLAKEIIDLEIQRIKLEENIEKLKLEKEQENKETSASKRLRSVLNHDLDSSLKMIVNEVYSDQNMNKVAEEDSL